MTKFFRNIRQRLLYENKLVKYLIYAIGEILIVLIGILIAVQIYNLNDSNKLKKIEVQVLSDIKKDLIQTKKDLQNNIKSHEGQVSDFDVLINNIEITKIYNDSLSNLYGSLFRFSSPYLTLASYENLKTGKGVELISNDSLKFKIVDLHEFTFKYLVEDMDRTEWLYFENFSLPALNKYFNYNSADNLVPKDYSALINDAEFLNILKFTKNLRNGNLVMTNYTINQIDVVIDAISKELE